MNHIFIFSRYKETCFSKMVYKTTKMKYHWFYSPYCIQWKRYECPTTIWIFTSSRSKGICFITTCVLANRTLGAPCWFHVQKLVELFGNGVRRFKSGHVMAGCPVDSRVPVEQNVGDWQMRRSTIAERDHIHV